MNMLQKIFTIASGMFLPIYTFTKLDIKRLVLIHCRCQALQDLVSS